MILYAFFELFVLVSIVYRIAFSNFFDIFSLHVLIVGCSYRILGARFVFKLDEGLKGAAASDEVRTAIAEKISRERIGHEVCFYFFIL